MSSKSKENRPDRTAGTSLAKMEKAVLAQVSMPLRTNDQGPGSWSGPQATVNNRFGAPGFDANKWETELRKRMDGRCIGYTYALTVNGVLTKIDGGGNRRLSIDGSNLSSNAYQVQHIASVTKPLTAVCALRILDLYNVNLGAKIKNYLPSHWTIHPNVENIRFRNLLKHKSGFNQSSAPTSYTKLKEAIETGDADPSMQGDTRFYDNRNFGLFRILIPYIANASYMADQEAIGTSNGNLNSHIDDITEALYENWMRFLVFSPLGFHGLDTKYDGSNPNATLAYQFPFNNQPGNDGPDWGPFSGGGGWVLSAYMLSKFMVYQKYVSSYFPVDLREKMSQQVMGWQEYTGDSGNSYLGHGGNFTTSGPVVTAVMQYPGNKEAVLLANSNITNLNTGNSLQARTILIKAYEKTVGLI